MTFEECTELVSIVYGEYRHLEYTDGTIKSYFDALEPYEYAEARAGLMLCHRDMNIRYPAKSKEIIDYINEIRRRNIQKALFPKSQQRELTPSEKEMLIATTKKKYPNLFSSESEQHGHE